MYNDVFRENEGYESVLHAKREVWRGQVTWEKNNVNEKEEKGSTVVEFKLTWSSAGTIYAPTGPLHLPSFSDSFIEYICLGSIISLSSCHRD